MTSSERGDQRVTLRSKSKWLVLIASCFLIVFADQLTKFWVLRGFVLGESSEVISGFFHFTYVRNPGAAFGLLASAPAWFRVPFFNLVPFIALFLIMRIFKSVSDTDRLLVAGFSGVLGGAIGNLIDRVRFGYVIDFLDFHWKGSHFPAFNIADITITVGVGLLLLGNLRIGLKESAIEGEKDASHLS